MDREYSSQRVLVMERFRGVSLIDLEGIKQYTDDPEGTLITALNTWFMSVVLCKSFHADVHAGEYNREEESLVVILPWHPDKESPNDTIPWSSFLYQAIS